MRGLHWQGTLCSSSDKPEPLEGHLAFPQASTPPSPGKVLLKVLWQECFNEESPDSKPSIDSCPLSIPNLACLNQCYWLLRHDFS